MCKQRGVITNYQNGRAPVRHLVTLGKRGDICIDGGTTWDDVMTDPLAWTFGHVDKKLVDFARELRAAKERAARERRAYA